MLSEQLVKFSYLLLVTASFCCFDLMADQSIKDCDTCPELVSIPAGNFDMRYPPGATGRGHNVGFYHEISIKYDFALGKFEVTNGEWLACVEASACKMPSKVDLSERSDPVTNISWRDAKAYTKWLSKLTGFVYRLPSNSEWEYAARAGLGMDRYFNIASRDLCNFANTYDIYAESILQFGFNPTPCDDGSSGLAKVGKYRPNNFGIYDTIGNVFEWTEDCAGPTVRAAFPRDGGAWLGGDCSLRGFRGSSWLINEPFFLIESSRFRSMDLGAEDLGFRVLREFRSRGVEQ